MKTIHRKGCYSDSNDDETTTDGKNESDGETDGDDITSNGRASFLTVLPQ